MSALSAPPASPMILRHERSDWERLAWALAVSLAIHLAAYGLYQLELRLHWLDALRLPDWFRKMQQAVATLSVKPPKPAEPQPEREVPLMFVEVSPEVATPVPPKDAKFYSSRNSTAANIEPDRESDAPKITGRQEHVPKAEDVPLSRALPLQPTPAAPPAPQEKEETPEERAKPTQPAGDLALAKPETQLRPDTGTAREPKPQTVAEAKMRLAARNQIPGEKMKQEGGVKRRALSTSFDAKATPFGAYDEAIINAVTRRWYDLLESQNFVRERTGKVTLEFHLNPDGRVTDMKVIENTVDELLCILCQKAILDPAPYAAWPSDMRRLVGAGFREVRFTFFYN